MDCGDPYGISTVCPLHSGENWVGPGSKGGLTLFEEITIFS